MIHFRHFINTDPPHLVKIWREQPEIGGQIPAITSLMCEANLFSKPYFDPNGLILAFTEVDQKVEPVGFVHASFTSDATGSDLDHSQGIVSILKVVDIPQADEVAVGLLKKACNYLKSNGAQTIHAGSSFPHAPFYLGLYGGSEIPGVLECDTTFTKALRSQGFQQQDRIQVWQRSLKTFRPIGGREQLAIRRKYQINAVVDPMPKSWWENCTLGMTHRERFSIFHKRDQTVCGDVSLWDMTPMYTDVAKARGIYGLNVSSEFRRTGIATFLLGETLKQMMQDGIEIVEAQTRESESAASGVFQKLGFETTFFGLLMTKELA